MYQYNSFGQKIRYKLVSLSELLAKDKNAEYILPPIENKMSLRASVKTSIQPASASLVNTPPIICTNHQISVPIELPMTHQIIVPIELPKTNKEPSMIIQIPTQTIIQTQLPTIIQTPPPTIVQTPAPMIVKTPPPTIVYPNPQMTVNTMSPIIIPTIVFVPPIIVTLPETILVTTNDINIVMASQKIKEPKMALQIIVQKKIITKPIIICRSTAPIQKLIPNIIIQQNKNIIRHVLNVPKIITNKVQNKVVILNTQKKNECKVNPIIIINAQKRSVVSSCITTNISNIAQIQNKNIRRTIINPPRIITKIIRLVPIIILKNINK